MSKPIKNLITEAYKQKFAGISGAVLLDLQGVESNDNNALRDKLAQNDIRVTVVKNSLAKKAFEGTDLEGLCELLTGPNAFVSGGESVVNVARELIDIVKEIKTIDFKGAIMDGMVFGPDEIKKLSEFPTKEEAQAKAVQIVLTPGQNLVGAAVSPGKNIAGILKTIQEKLENGETIAKAS